MNALKLPAVLNLISISLAVFGVYFCYRGVIRGKGMIARYLVWFFGLTLFVRFFNLVETLLIPRVSQRWAGYILWCNLPVTFLSHIAFAVLVAGCYLDYRQRKADRSGRDGGRLAPS